MNAIATAPAVDLARFTAAPTRPSLAAPFAIRGGTLATNGSLAIWVATPCDTPPPSTIKHPLIENLVDEAMAALSDESGVWVSVGEIVLGELKCGACEGVGRCTKSDCDHCGGDGTFWHGRWEYDCKECGGDGRTSEPSTSTEAPWCDDCKGTGIKWNQVSSFKITRDGKEYSANSTLVALLRILPDCQLLSSRFVGNDAFAVRFTGGVGVLMPMRV